MEISFIYFHSPFLSVITQMYISDDEQYEIKQTIHVKGKYTVFT